MRSTDAGLPRPTKQPERSGAPQSPGVVLGSGTIRRLVDDRAEIGAVGRFESALTLVERDMGPGDLGSVVVDVAGTRVREEVLH